MSPTIVRALSIAGLAITASRSLGAQEVARLTGRVVDAADKIPISGAAITVTGTTIGALATDSGTFSLRLPTDAKTLSVRRIGYHQATIPITPGVTDLTIALDRNVLKLEQQVITGVATTVSSKNAANDVAVVTASAVNEVPAPTMENAIQGKVAGAVIQANNGGAPGGGLQIQVRGITSINGNASPLYVIDGVIVNNETVNNDANAISQSGGGISTTGQPTGNAPSRQDNGVNRIADINPEDIETIEVLKGASASAIYGSQASAGVVVITTKKGTPGKPKWNLDTQVGHFALANELPDRTFPTLASALAWGQEFGKDPTLIRQVYAGPQDYQRQLFGNNQASYSANLSVSGTVAGGTQFYLAGNSKYDNGVENNIGYTKQSIRANVTQPVSSAISLSANLSYMHDLTRRGITGNDNIGLSPYNVIANTPQFVALDKQNPDGTWPSNPFASANPFADAADIATPEEVSRFIGGGVFDWTVFQAEHQSLKLTINGGADLTSLHDLLYAPPDLQVELAIPTGLPGTSVSNVAQTNYFNYAINLNHHYTGLQWLDANTTLGFTRDRRETNNPVTVGQNLLPGVNSPTVGTVQTNFFTRTAQLDQSLYAQEQLLTFDSHLNLTAGLTAERSTNDGDIKTFSFFPHYSASYRTPAFSVVNELKLRVAYGQSGNLAPYGAKYTPYNPTIVGGGNGVYVNAQQGDPNIKPESETEIETGIDATLFHSRAQLTATIYQKRLTDLLLLANVAPTLGYQFQFFNGGELTNQGLELSLNSTPIQLRNGFNWLNSITFYRNYSVVNALPTPSGPIGFTFGFGEGFLAPGRSVSEVVDESRTGPGGLPVQVGDFQPGYRINVGNEFGWKGFRLYGLIEWSQGGSTIDLTDLYFDGGPGLSGDPTASTARLNSFLGGNPTEYVQDASYFKVRQISLSYVLPANIARWALGGRINSARLTLSGYNMFSVFKFPGLDPEASVNGNQQITRGQDIAPYPPAKSYFLGLNLGF